MAVEHAAAGGILPIGTNRRRLGDRLRPLLLVFIPAWIYFTIASGLLGQMPARPTLAFSYAGIFVLYLVTLPSRAEVLVVVAVGFVLRAFATAQPAEYPLAFLAQLGAYFGVAAVAALIFRAVSARDPKPAQLMLFRSLIFMVLGILIGQLLELASRIRPIKLDLSLYALDQALGMPSFAVGRLFQAFPWFASLEKLIYYSLPFALCAMYAARLRRSIGRVEILTILYVNAIVGFMLYFLFPACGPGYVFSGDFPNVAHVLEAADIVPVAVGCPPNAMPSLHLSGALLVCWNSWCFRRGRIIGVIFLALTILATMGFGEHYVIDLVVAFPFALFAQAVATESPNRAAIAFLGAAQVALWIGAFYRALPVLLIPSVLVAGIAMTICASAFGLLMLTRTAGGSALAQSGVALEH